MFIIVVVQRILGIACGVILLEITAVLVYPRSASQEAVAKMGQALEKLAELNRMTWVHGPWESPSQKSKRQAPCICSIAHMCRSTNCCRPSTYLRGKSDWGNDLASGMMHSCSREAPPLYGLMPLQWAMHWKLDWTIRAGCKLKELTLSCKIGLMLCRERPDGYEALPGDGLEEGDSKEAAQEQAAREDKYERMLMDVYNTLYKATALNVLSEALTEHALSP